MKFRRLLSPLALVAGPILTGCVSQIALLPDFKASDDSASIKVVDMRPSAERTSETLSFSITSCDYAVRRLGDEATVPSRIPLLQSDLSRILDQSFHGKVLTVSHYTIHFNNASALRQRVYSRNAGVIAEIMKDMGSNCSREKTTGGWYASSEVTGPYSPIIVEIATSIDGKQSAIRSVYTPPKEVVGGFGDTEPARAVFEAIRKATGELAEAIKQDAKRT